MEALRIEWRTSTPLWPQANGNAESIMKPIGKVIKTATLEGKNWRQELQRFLINFRSTPHATTKVPPCELLFNRKIQGTLPELTTKKVINKHKEAKENIDKRKHTNKKYYDVKKRAKASNIKEGDTVICEQKPVNKLSPRSNQEKFTVIKRKGPTVVARNDRRTITRNVSHFKLMKSVEEESDYEDQSVKTNYMGNELEREEYETAPRRPKRDQRPVKRYGITVPSELIS